MPTKKQLIKIWENQVEFLFKSKKLTIDVIDEGIVFIENGYQYRIKFVPCHTKKRYGFLKINVKYNNFYNITFSKIVLKDSFHTKDNILWEFKVSDDEYYGQKECICLLLLKIKIDLIKKLSK